MLTIRTVGPWLRPICWLKGHDWFWSPAYGKPGRFCWRCRVWEDGQKRPGPVSVPKESSE